MFVFCVVQGIVALISTFTVMRAEFLRDSVVYLVSLSVAALIISDGVITLFEVSLLLFSRDLFQVGVVTFSGWLQGIALMSMYAGFMLLLVYFRDIVGLISIPELKEESEAEPPPKWEEEVSPPVRPVSCIAIA